MTRVPTSTLDTRWVLNPPADPTIVRRLARELSIPLPLAGLLAQRGHADPEGAKTFLRPTLDDLSDPASLMGMDKAVNRIVRAVEAGENILVHGDYDVDGQSATALLTRALREAGARAIPFVPHRLRDGYDFGPAGLAEAQRLAASLIVTCDCGITAVETVAQAAEAGIDVIVTDHHLPGSELPRAIAVIDPQQAGDESGLEVLCGTGIAFKLVQALVAPFRLPETYPLHGLDLVALATVADVVPLVGENRTLVRHGLRLLQQTRWVGLKALIRSSGLEGKTIRAGQVGFILAPRLNAAGRVGEAADGLRLLLSDDPAEAAKLADRLEVRNTERQDLDARILDEAIDLVEQEFDSSRDSAIVLGGEGWHPGVVGIVASRVVERYGRPTFLVAFDGDTGKGSGRSISRFDLHAALVECGDLLDRYGGHKMAGGLTIARDRFHEFRERFHQVARRHLEPDSLGPEQRVDLLIDLDDATDDLERLCRYLEPCGMGNPSPVFGIRDVEFEEPKIVGHGHLKGVLREGRHRLDAIGFNLAERSEGLLGGGRRVDAALRLEQNEFRGKSTLQARLLALTSADSLKPSDPQ